MHQYSVERLSQGHIDVLQGLGIKTLDLIENQPVGVEMLLIVD